MPQAIPLVIMATATAAELTGAALIAAQVAAVASSVAVASVESRKARKKAAAEAEASRRDLMVTVRSSIEPRRIAYGRVRLGGVMAFAHSWGEENKVLHQVLVLTGHEIDAYEAVYFNDDLVEFQGSTLPAATFSHPTGGKYAIGGAAAAHVTAYAGTATQTADPTLLSVAAGKWTANHRLRGCGYLQVQTNHAPDVWTNGLVSVAVVARCARLFDVRDAGTRWSSNPALVIRDYLARAFPTAEFDDASFIAAANTCDEWVSVNVTGMADEARWRAMLDAEVGYGTWESMGAGVYRQRRYDCNLVVTELDRPGDVLESMVATCAGYLSNTGGLWRLVAGAYNAPTLTLTADDLRAGPGYVPHPARRDISNVVKGTYAGPSSNYVPAAFPAVESAAYIAADGGEIPIDIALEGVSDAVRAQRRAAIALKRTRLGVLSFPAKMGVALALRPGDTVAVTLELFGWVGKVFRVEEWALADDMGIDLVLREDAPEVWTWTLGDAEIADPAPELALPSPWVLAAPAALSASSGDAFSQVAEDGTVVARVRLAWTAGVDGNKVEIESRVVGAATWTPHPEADDAAGAALLAGLAAGAAVEIRARRRNVLGVRSAWATVTHTVLGKDLAPPAPNGFAVTQIVNRARRWNWTLPTLPADVVAFECRMAAGSTIDWATATRLWTHSAVPGVLAYAREGWEPSAAGTYTFALRTLDASGNLSDTAATVTAALDDATVQLAVPPNSEFVRIVNVLPDPATYTGPRLVLVLTTMKLYRFTGTSFTSVVDNADIPPGTLAGDRLIAGSVTAGLLNVTRLSAITTVTGSLTLGFPGESHALATWGKTWDSGYAAGTWLPGEGRTTQSGLFAARYSDGNYAINFTAGANRVWMSTWGDTGINFSDKFIVDAAGNVTIAGVLSSGGLVVGGVNRTHLAPESATKFVLSFFNDLAYSYDYFPEFGLGYYFKREVTFSMPEGANALVDITFDNPSAETCRAWIDGVQVGVNESGSKALYLGAGDHTMRLYTPSTGFSNISNIRFSVLGAMR